MEILIVIVDNTDEEHDTLKLKLENESTVEELQRAIESIFNVSSTYQILIFDGKTISLCEGNTRLQSLGLNHRCKVILKHLCLRNWVLFCRFFDLANKTKSKHTRKEYVRGALQQHKTLISYNFFNLYPKFIDSIDEFQSRYAHYFDNDKEAMQAAAVSYFSKLLQDNPENPKINITLKDKSFPGAQGGYICEVKNGEDLVALYHLKTHMGTASRGHEHSSPDLREIFMYRLNEKIQIGPEVHFLPNLSASGEPVRVDRK